MKTTLSAKLCALLSLLLICSLNAMSQNVLRPGHVVMTPGGIFDTVFDRFGNKYPLSEVKVNTRNINKYDQNGTAASIIKSTCNSGYFQLWLEKGSGMEQANNPSSPDHSLHQARLAVLCQVLSDISNFIQSPLSATGVTQKINICVKAAPTGAGILGLASPLFLIPRSTISGVTDDAIWTTLNSGRDAYTNVSSPLESSGGVVSGTTYFHGTIMFDFVGVGWNTSLSSAPTVSGQYDLYTVALHEMMHALGFMSVIDFTGQSIFGANYPYFTKYDTHLSTSTGANLITQLSGSGTCSLYDWQFNPALTPATTLAPSGTSCSSPADHTSSCATAIRYSGGTTQKVYYPDCFKFGTSLSHFEDECLPTPANNQYFLMSNAGSPGPYNATTNPGAMKRHPTPEERLVLCDIGYKVNASFGVGPAPGPYLNYTTYTGGVCGHQVAGINDGITATGSYLFQTPPSAPVYINGPLATGGYCLLTNDGGAVSFKCLEVVQGNGIISPTSGTCTTNVQFTPSFGSFGLQLLRYTPVDAAGNEGNITYVYVDVSDTGCKATACNLVRNGGFESSHSFPMSTSMSEVHCWGETGSADLGPTRLPTFLDGILTDTPYCHPLSEGSNNFVVGIVAGGDTSGYICENIFQRLSTSIYPGQTFNISFWAHVWDIPRYNLTGHLLFALSNSSSLSSVPYLVSGLPPGLVPLKEFTITHPNNLWQYYSEDVTYTDTTVGNSLVILQQPWLNDTPTSRYIVMDDIVISPASAKCTWTLPDSFYTSHPPILLDSTVSIPGPNPVFKWITTGNVVTTSTTFNPAPAHDASVAAGDSGYVTLSYTYGPSECRRTIYKQVKIIGDGLGVDALHPGSPQYSIFPNPNNGDFVVRQSAVDNDPVSISVYDIIGKVVYHDTHTFSGQELKLRLNIPPGTYIGSIENKDHARLRFKLQIR